MNINLSCYLQQEISTTTKLLGVSYFMFKKIWRQFSAIFGNFWQYLPTFFDQIFIDDHISTTQHDIVSILENNIEYGVKIDYKSLKKLYLPLVDNREQVKWKFVSTRISEKLNILHYADTF